jgi:histidinol phosphatase-like PHP family hydrolase
VQEMATKLAPLLCELHAHTTWSNGALTVRELCDLHGRAGFDVLAVTDHTLAEGHVQEAGFPAWTDWYRFAGDELGYEHDERVQYANLRYVEEQNRESLRRAWGSAT